MEEPVIEHDALLMMKCLDCGRKQTTPSDNSLVATGGFKCPRCDKPMEPSARYEKVDDGGGGESSSPESHETDGQSAALEGPGSRCGEPPQNRPEPDVILQQEDDGTSQLCYWPGRMTEEKSDSAYLDIDRDERVDAGTLELETAAEFFDTGEDSDLPAVDPKTWIKAGCPGLIDGELQ